VKFEATTGIREASHSRISLIAWCSCNAMAVVINAPFIQSSLCLNFIKCLRNLVAMNWERPRSSRSPSVGRSPTSHKRRSMVKCESCRKKRIKVGDLVLPMVHLIQAHYFVVYTHSPDLAWTEMCSLRGARLPMRPERTL
jgi:hypothetical protein